MIAITVAIVPLATGWVSGGWGWVLAITGAGGIGFLGLWLLLSWKKAAGIAGAIALIIGIISSLHGFAPTDRPSTRQPVKQSSTN